MINLDTVRRLLHRKSTRFCYKQHFYKQRQAKTNAEQHAEAKF